MSGDWSGYGHAQQPYQNTYYQPQPPSHPQYTHQPHQIAPHAQHQIPQAHPQHQQAQHPQQYLGHGNPSPVEYPYGGQVNPYPFPGQAQAQPQATGGTMPTRGSSRPVPPPQQQQQQQGYAPQDLYSPHTPDSNLGELGGRNLRQRAPVNYAQQPPLARAVPPPTSEGPTVSLRTRGSRPNYKEPDADEEFQPDDDELGYVGGGGGGGASRPKRATRGTNSVSYSEAAYGGGDDGEDYKPDVGQQAQYDAAPKEEEEVIIARSSRGRVVRRKKVVESSESDEDGEPKERRVKSRGNEDFIAPENDDDEDVDVGDETFGQERHSRLTRGRAPAGGRSGGGNKSSKKEKRRKEKRRRRGEGSEDDYIDEDDDFSDEALSDLQRTESSPPRSEDLTTDLVDKGLPRGEGGRGGTGRSKRLRTGQPMNYNEIAAFEKMEQNGLAKVKSKKKKEKTNWTGQDYLNAGWGMPAVVDDDSDAEPAQRSPNKLAAAGIGLGPDAANPLGGLGKVGTAGGKGPAGGGDMLAGGAAMGLDLAGTPSNMGKIGEAGLADADPLGVNMNVSFEDVGGLDEHVSKLKEMTLLPLLYPDMFQAIGVTPPRGVLFHGPPGTGKTLVARALAASCRSEGRSVSFFMRKGADILSKWVGEAERQLRLLFEEAKKTQPSIIFFDEIDGLAPVRSSKQDQIHASIVSTLLALMDGMDGRGQVIVIGATNRPDAIDPALRRPGRFDREFYFPLPNFDARMKILEIMTKQWDNWKAEKGEENRRSLAKLTKGYGGADLRALCTEAALNAIKRQYPQIYESSERLKLDHTKIAVQARDFMISVKDVVPSSARSSASAAAVLPKQLVPLLGEPLKEVQASLDIILPKSKKRSALEEAQWEEDHPDGEAGAFEREMMLQALESQRINRPRLLLSGGAGSGQRAVGAAALHYLEGYSVQSFDMGTLTGDPARTPEAAIVQLFIEAKRHAPSIIYIPSLNALCASLPETCRALVADSLEALEPHEPILLLAILSGNLKSLPRDVRTWFGKSNSARIVFSNPSEAQRREFFKELLEYVNKSPSQFPDAVKRRRRVLEKLEKAPPLAPREPSAAEVAFQQKADQLLYPKLRDHLVSIFKQCKKADKSFCSGTIAQTFGDVKTEDGIWWGRPQRRDDIPPPNTAPVLVEGEEAVPAVNGEVNGDQAVAIPTHTRQRLNDIDMPRILNGIWDGEYLTSVEFLNAIALVRQNAILEKNEEDPETVEVYRRAEKVWSTAQEEVSRTEPNFNLETERMARRIRDRLRKVAEVEAKAKEEAEKADPAEIPKEGDEDIAMKTSTPPAEPGSEERLALKRARDEEGNNSEGSQPPSKRMRMSPFPEIEGTGEKSVRFADQPSLPAIAVNGSALPDSDMSVDPPSPSPNVVNGEVKAPEVEVAPMGLTQHVLRAPSRTPSPGPSTPPEFIASPSLLSNLENALATKTANLDVEQLEALRALCLNLVWKHKSDWNRDALMTEMMSTINEYLVEVGEASEGED